jgi:chemotaxis protein methyltransferase CheR
VGLAPDAIVAIAGRLAERAGLALPAWVVDARATARIAALGCTADEYVALIDSARGAGELAELIEAVRVGESRLFRHRSQIAALASVVAPALRAQGRRTIRAWSAGCAAGEEPYTLAIVLSRALPDCAISILATDVSADALARARTASYPSAAIQHVPAQYRDAFRDDGSGRVCVVPELVALVQFERANLLDGPVPRGCDLVWCRNVLIYFTADARRRAIDRLVGATLPGGYLFVGYSESLRDIEALDALRASESVYYVRRPADAAPRSRPPTVLVERAPAFEERTPPSPTSEDQTSPRIDRRSSPVLAQDGGPRPAAGRQPPSRAFEDRTPPPAFDRRSPPRLADDRTPTPQPPGRHGALVLRGRPSAAELTAEISAALAQPALESLVIDLDGVELLDDELVRVLRRARAAACTAEIELDMRATRAGVVRWLARHGLGESEAAAPIVRPPVRRS